MAERPANAIPGLRMTAEQFNAARAQAPNGDLRKIDTAAAEASIAGPTNPAKLQNSANPVWPWLPPGISGNDPVLKRVLTSPFGTVRGKHAAPTKAVSLQVCVELDKLTQVSDGSMLSTLTIAPSTARYLAAQLLQAAMEAENTPK